MKIVRFVWPAVAAVVAALALPQTAMAVKGYQCGCTAEKDQTCTCTYNYTLGKSGTQEFRGTCTKMDKDGIWPDISIGGKAGGTSCTIQLDISGSPDYTTRSCTNWNPFSKDDIRVHLECTNSEGEIYPPASSP